MVSEELRSVRLGDGGKRTGRLTDGSEGLALRAIERRSIGACDTLRARPIGLFCPLPPPHGYLVLGKQRDEGTTSVVWPQETRREAHGAA